MKLLLFVAGLLPALWLSKLVVTNDLGANPIKGAILYTGLWALRFLCLALAVSPVARIAGIKSIMRYRRMIGLYAFFYAFLHMATYTAIDQFFDFKDILADVTKRPFIMVGFATFVILTLLAATSPKTMVRQLGGRNWQKLHRLVYVAGIGAVLHFIMSVKADVTEPLIYFAIVLALLALRLTTPFARRMTERDLSPKDSDV